MNDTICALATPQGGAISVVRISGPKAIEYTSHIFTPRKGQPLASRKSHTAVFGDVCVTPCELLDEVLVTVMRAPHTYTGEDVVEISCHASSYITQQLMLALLALGARQADPGEFTMRAFLNGKMDLSRAEAVADLIASSSKASHRLAMNQLKGDFSNELAALRNKLLKLTTLMELELDFSEEDVTFADRSELMQLCDEIDGVMTRLTDSFAVGNAVKNGVPVAIVGETNAGKSTLLNALLGEDRAIVSDVHGTTRDTIEETMNIDGVLFRFIDTAGLRETSEVVEKIGIERTFKKISEASIVLGMVDLTRDFETTCETVRKIMEKVDFTSQKLIILLNKVDISNINKNVSIENFIVSEIDNKYIRTQTGKNNADDANSPSIIRISAKTGEGIDRLRAVLADSQRDILADSDTTLVTNQRHIQALSDSRTSLLRVREGLASCLPTDLASQDIREAIYHLGSIVGEISTDEVLGNIFANFCIGK